MPRFSSTESGAEFAHSRDAADMLNEEVQKSVDLERKKKRSWQTFIFIVAAIKYYVLSCTFETSLVYSVIQRQDEKVEGGSALSYGANGTELLTYTFAMLLFGNLADNCQGQ